MRVVFDPALDGPSWPGPLGGRPVAFGERWVGPLGLMGILETQLGLGGYLATSLERACGLSRLLEALDGYWRRSFDRDPIGTSRRLLEDRDTLAMWGWRGEAVSARLADLGKATAGAAPGLPDRIAAVARALEKRKPDLGSLVLRAPPHNLAPGWQDLIGALERRGVIVEHSPVTPVEAQGDLARARKSGFVPEGDGSLCLLRRYGTLDAADEVAATLAALDDLDGLVVIGGDAVLDGALQRRGLPRLGQAGAAPASSRILPLVIEAAFEPMEPGDLHGLLTLDPGPIPRAVGAPLLRALREQPGRRSDAWAKAMTDALARLDTGGERLAERLESLLAPAVPRGKPLATEVLRMRLEVLRAWANARARTVGSLAVVGQQVRTLLEAVALLGVDQLSRAQLRRLCSEIDPGEWAPHDAEAGLAHIRQPGALLGPAPRVVWWNFTRGQAPRAPRLFLTSQEESALAAAGLPVPDFARLMEAEAMRWRRPLLLATQTLVLVCPQTNDGGEANQPHPLWDELTASLAQPEHIHRLQVSGLSGLARIPTVATVSRALVKPALEVTGTALGLREKESPSSLERLIGCSLAWALHYRGRLEEGMAEGPALLDSRLLGSLAHHLLAQVFSAGPEDPEAAAGRAARAFDEQAPRLCEAIELPAHQVQRATLRRVVVESARELTRLMRQAGARVAGTELAQRTVVQGQAMEGRIDLVLEDPDFIIDLKWGKVRQRQALETGTALQLAAYAAMRAAECGRPGVGVGYFLLKTQELLTGPQAALGAGYAVGTHPNVATWAGALAQLQVRRNELTQGLLRAPGADGSDDESTFDGTTLALAPSCGYCAFGGLCGRKGTR
jgi:ATP-dependent helicase/nuclease subunit B